MNTKDKYYLWLGKASDLKDKNERRIYRFLEILPGFLSWFILAMAIFLSWFRPLWVAVFIISFDFYWLLRTMCFTLYTRSAIRKMKENEQTDWAAKLNSLNKVNRDKISKELTNISDWKDIYHLVILPMFKEPLEVIKPSFLALADCDYPKEKMIVVLATEERGGEEDQKTARLLEKEFSSKFFKFLITKHPSDIKGELAGKGSNEAWAAKRAKEEIIDCFKIPYENVIVSPMDVDSVIFPKYFSCLAYYYLISEKPTRTSFQPIPFFINNIWEAPALSRVIAFSSTFWHAANQERPEKHLTFSTHSMSFKALVEVGFWQTNVVSEDSRIFWQCFLRFDGDYRVVSLHYPISMDANAAKTFWRTLVNIYKQQRRWAYGAADIPYWLFGFLKNKKIPFFLKWQYGFPVFEGFLSWSTNAIIIFILGWLPLVLGAERFSNTLLSFNLPILTRNLLTLAMIGIVASAYLAITFLPSRPSQYGKWKYFIMVAQWFLIPVSLIIFGSFPALDAQTRLMLGKYMGFWPTEKVRKS